MDEWTKQEDEEERPPWHRRPIGVDADGKRTRLLTRWCCSLSTLWQLARRARSLLSWPLSFSLLLSSFFHYVCPPFFNMADFPHPLLPSSRRSFYPLPRSSFGCQAPSLEHSCNRPTGREHFVRTLSSTRRLQITCIRRYRFRDRCRGREVLGGQNVPVFNGKMLG